MDEGVKIKIDHLGIERYGSDNRTEEIGCNEIVGMIYRDGSLHPYAPLKYNVSGCGIGIGLQQTSLQNTDKMWVHKTTHQNNIIVLFRNSITQILELWWTEESAFMTQMKSSSPNYGLLTWTKIANIPNGINKIDFVNNIIVYNHTIHIFSEGRYSSPFDTSNVQFRMDIGAQGNGVALMYDGVEFSSQTIYSSYGKYMENTFDADDTYKRINANFKILQNEVRRGDYISGACFLRYAIKLYDGSYIHVSNPVLITPDIYYEVEGERYDGNVKTFTWNSNPVKFCLKHTITNPAPAEGLRLTPQLGLIQSMFGSACWWAYLQLVDNGSYISTMQSCADWINNVLEGSTNPIISSGQANFSIAKYYLGNKGNHDNFQPLDLNYWLLSKGGVKFRELFQFNNSKFRKEMYYSVVQNGASKSLRYFDYVTPVGTTSMQSFNYNRGWTWGVIPFIVPIIHTDNSQEHEQNSGNLHFLLAATCSPYYLGQDGLFRTTNPVNNLTGLIDEDLCKFIKHCGGNDTNHWYSHGPIKTADYFDSTNSWFTTRFSSTDNIKVDYENKYVGFGIYADQKLGISTVADNTWKGQIFAPLNEHIGELGFGVINTPKYEGSSSQNNLAMAFGRELYTPVYRVNEKFPSNMKDLISSIDIFMSAPVDMHEDYGDNLDYRSMPAHRPYRPITEVNNDLEKSLANFYKIHSIPYEEIDLTPIGKTIMPYLERGSISALENQELLVTNGDNSYDYNVSYVYNNKLHIAQITENINNAMFQDCNTCINLNENPRVHSTNHPYDMATQSQLSAQARRDKTFSSPNHFNEYKTNILAALNRTTLSGATLNLTNIPTASLYFRMKMTIDNRSVDIIQNRDFSLIDDTPLNPCFYYPNADVDSATVLGIEIKDANSNNKYFLNTPNKVYSLKKNKVAIASSFINLRQIINDIASVSNLSTYTIEDNVNNFAYKQYISNNSYKRDLNLFKVSANNQPIVFPLATTYNVGYGKIIAFSSFTTALSQGQFGEYPLLIFTTEGIFAMAVDTSGIGTYLSNSPLSREVCVNANTIVQTDQGVFFASDKGLMLVSGQNVMLWSDKINGEPRNIPENSGVVGDGMQVYYNAITTHKLVNLFSANDNMAISFEDFRAYLADQNTYISYIYEMNKLLCFNTNKKYVYFVSLTEDRLCTKLYISDKIKYSNDNYPSSLFLSGAYTLEFDLDGRSTDVDCMIQTRPIMIDTNNFKSSYRAVLRGMFNIKGAQSSQSVEQYYHGLYILGSLDSHKWMYIGGTEQGGFSGDVPTINDIGTTIERMGVKYLMAIYVGKNYSYKINGDRKTNVTRIDNFEISTNEKFNDKTR